MAEPGVARKGGEKHPVCRGGKGRVEGGNLRIPAWIRLQVKFNPSSFSGGGGGDQGNSGKGRGGTNALARATQRKEVDDIFESHRKEET